ncbi:AraC family transcriptional regulator [Mangrovimonas sp. YM274]|uniref:helix-turn-helix domain-containing protein n=1 Tax=Mangrovimonas sp. YM274 TaxID=3070660 RepID=UPI0027DE25F4|nr:helix-turn-helix domain-containing protein [Mangrovimonas sp. YM274]WMI68149.1 helix-turn-helix domain-containing protein [Mangrovimonas sp. YM274]
MSIAYVFALLQLNSFPLKSGLLLPFYNKMVILDFISISSYSLINLYILYNNKTEIDSLKFNLLKFISLTFLGMIFMPLIFLMLEVFGMHIDNRLVYIFTLAIVVGIAIYKVKAKGVKLELVTQTKQQDKTQKYNSSTLSDVDLDTYQSKLETYFEQKKPYLNPELTLQHLALKSDIPKHHLTQVLNTRFHKNFYQYVNEFRVNEVIKNMPLKRHDALVDIAYQCGFNSKSTFNSYFKKITGLTPSEFKKQHEFTA